MMSFLAVPLLILIVALVVGFPIVAIQKWAHRHDRPAPAHSPDPGGSPKAPGS